MTTRTCETCSELKPLSEYRRAGRGHARSCLACEEPEPAAEPVQATPDKLTMAPGFGFTGWIEDGVLRISQTNTDGSEDHLALSRTEAKVLFAQFQAWVNA